MKNFLEWFDQNREYRSRPWLILGKGPSYSKRNQFDTSGYCTISLNHVVREQPVTAAHVIDYDVVEACSEAIERHADVLIMPWFPHVKQRIGKDTLDDYLKKNRVLQRLDQQNRLLWYNLRTAPNARPGCPVIDVGFFSSEAVLNLLATAGVQRVRSLGIDGGASYSREFEDLKDDTLLAVRWKTFDHQFAGIAKCILNTGIDYAPLDAESPIRIYVGATEEQMLAVKVLEYSIRKHASMTVEVMPLHYACTEIPAPKNPRNIGKTPFSFQRFLIPELAGYRGRAIYLDSDMLVFRDIRRLWVQPFDGAQILASPSSDPSSRSPQFSVMLLNCDDLHWDIRQIIRDLDNGKYTYEQVLYNMGLVERMRQSLDPAWNSLESYKEEETALIHYTDMPTQPWVYHENPFGYLWMRELFQAVDRKFVPEDFIAEHVRRRWVRPTLLYQVQHRVEDGLLLPRKVLKLDQSFVYPWELKSIRGSSWLRPFRVVRAALRQRYYCSGMYHFMKKLHVWLHG